MKSEKPKLRPETGPFDETDNRTDNVETVLIVNRRDLPHGVNEKMESGYMNPTSGISPGKGNSKQVEGYKMELGYAIANL